MTDWSSTGTLTNVISPEAPFGARNIVVSFSGGGTTVTNTVHLPQAAKGGEDFVVSAYVQSFAGTFVINGTSYVTESPDFGVWHRIYGVYKLAAGATTLNWTIQFIAPDNNPRQISIDGIQGEYGRLPRKFVNPNDSNVTVIPNPLHAGKSIYAIQTESTNSGKANYLNNYSVKISRLQNTLQNYMPNGSSFAIKTGHEFYGYRDLDQSLAPNNSFETNLGGWVGVGSSLARVISRGASYDENVTHGHAYCKVTNSMAVLDFGLYATDIFITDDGSYYASIAVRPGNADTAGDYTLTLDFYNALDALVYTKSITKTVTSTDRWAYIADTYSIADIGGAYYAKLSVTATPTAGYVAGQNFDIDRVVFRQ
jgi:hypothetical protein